MGKIVRYISEDGSVTCCVVDTTDVAAKAEQLHTTSATVTAALGRLLTGTTMMGYMMKGEKDTVTTRLHGNGPVGSLIAVANSKGDVKGYATNPIVELPLNSHGKLDVAGAVGTEGFLTVIKDTGMEEASTGNSPIVSGEIAEDFTYYYAKSEQIPTVCALGVLVNTDLTVIAAGGYLIQLLPGAAEEAIDILEQNVAKIPAISTLIAEGKTVEEIAVLAMEGLSPQLLDEGTAQYLCDCSRERVERALISIGKEELQQMIDEGEVTQVECHFCNRKEQFTPQDLLALIKEGK